MEYTPQNVTVHHTSSALKTPGTKAASTFNPSASRGGRLWLLLKIGNFVILLPKYISKLSILE
jgi:hypothetical protein